MFAINQIIAKIYNFKTDFSSWSASFYIQVEKYETQRPLAKTTAQ